mgnify:CR=1 FL=1
MEVSGSWESALGRRGEARRTEGRREEGQVDAVRVAVMLEGGTSRRELVVVEEGESRLVFLLPVVEGGVAVRGRV